MEAAFRVSSSGCFLLHPRYGIHPRKYGQTGVSRTPVPARIGPASNGAAAVAVSAAAAADASSQHKLEEVYEVKEHTLDAQTPKGRLSPAAINAIEQFSRMNGLTGRKTRANFESFAPVAVQNEARNLDGSPGIPSLDTGSSKIPPSLKAACRMLHSDGFTFVTMLGWQQPYNDGSEEKKDPRVNEEAFVRIASAIPGVADRVTAHSLFKALTDGANGLSFSIWDRYLAVLCKAVKRTEETATWTLNQTRISGFDRPSRVLHFQPFRLMQQANWSRLDITSSGSEPWLLEFVDFSGKGRRGFWFVYIKELLSVYKFIREYAPKLEDPAVEHVYGAKAGKGRALISALLSITRVQALQATTDLVATWFYKL